MDIASPVTWCPANVVRMDRAAAAPSTRAPTWAERAWVRSLLGVGQHGHSAYAIAVTVGGIALALATIGPVGTSGAPLAVAALLGVNCVLLTTRALGSGRVSSPVRTAFLWSGVVASVALLAVARTGAVTLFGFFVAGQAGFWLPPSRAVPIALACSSASAGVLLLGWGGGDRAASWLGGAATGLAVLAGLFIRSRQQLLLAALKAAESAERAARSETREAILAERGRIARDVHDVLAHSLAAVSMQLSFANALLDGGDVARARQLTEAAQNSVRGSLVAAQRSVGSLRAESIPLVETLEAMTRSGAMTAAFEVTGPPRVLGDEISHTMIRTTQESLTNAHKHAFQAAIRVSLAFLERRVELAIVNEAPTVTAPSPPGSGLGLIGMRERAAHIGATLSAGPVLVGTCPGGWRVHLAVPT